MRLSERYFYFLLWGNSDWDLTDHKIFQCSKLQARLIKCFFQPLGWSSHSFGHNLAQNKFLLDIQSSLIIHPLLVLYSWIASLYFIISYQSRLLKLAILIHHKKSCMVHLNASNQSCLFITGWFWSGSGGRIAPTNSTPFGWPERPWSNSGFIGQFFAGMKSSRLVICICICTLLQLGDTGAVLKGSKNFPFRPTQPFALQPGEHFPWLCPSPPSNLGPILYRFITFKGKTSSYNASHQTTTAGSTGWRSEGQSQEKFFIVIGQRAEGGVGQKET